MTIEANNCTFSGFNWTGAPVTEYRAGEKFDMGTLKVVARYRNASNQFVDADVTKYVTADKDVLTSEDNDTQVTLSVEYDGNSVATGAVNASKSYTLKVRDLQELKVTSNPTTLEYYEGQFFSTAGMVITGVFDTGEDIITSYTYSPSGPLTVEDTAITVSYQGQSVIIPIKVSERKVSKFEVKYKPYNLIYAADEEFDPSGMTVNVYYDYAPNTPVTLQAAEEGENSDGKYTCEVDGNTVTVKYKEKEVVYSDSFDITILTDKKPQMIEGVYQLSTPEHMVWFANQINSLGNGEIDGVLLNDIDLSDEKLFLPIGYANLSAIKTGTKGVYSGNFDGKNHTITVDLDVTEMVLDRTGKELSKTNKKVGLFGAVKSATIKNIVLDGNIASDNSAFVGGIAGYTPTGSTLKIENCINKVNITSYEDGTCYMGGILGRADATKNTQVGITDCGNEGDIISSCDDPVGGILGDQGGNNTVQVFINNCYNTGNVKGLNYIGGISGRNCYGAIENCFNSGIIVSENTIAGGISGYISDGAAIRNCYNKGFVTAVSYAGGLVGRANSQSVPVEIIEKVYNIGAVSETNAESGTAGMICGSIDAAGLSIKNAYYIDGSSIPAYNESGEGYVTFESVEAKTTEALKAEDILTLLGDSFTFVHSDTINDGYPVLTWQVEKAGDDVHVWDDGVITKEPTTSAEGEMTYTCTVEGCEATKTESIAKLPSGGGGGGGSAVTNYTVTFDSNGGSSVAKQTVASGETASKPADPTKEGYTFGGWYTDKELTEAYDFGTTVKKSITLYAKWNEEGEEPGTEEPGTEPGTGTAGTFTDVAADSWYAEYVTYLADKGIVNGKTETTFEPNSNITRAEFIKIIAGVAGADVSGASSSKFSDVTAGSWYAPYVAWGVENGLINGVSDTSFAKFELPQTVTPVEFADGADIASYAKDAVAEMQKAGIINGKDANRFAPEENATRAEACKMLTILMQQMGK